MTVLLIAEHNNRNLKPVTAQVVTAALEMGGPVDVLVLGNDCRSIAEEAAKIAGVRTAYFADNPQFAQESPEAIAEIVVREGKGYDHILFVTGALGKTVMPRVAALMDVSPVSEILAVKGPKTFVRGMYAGSILATVEVDESVVVATVRGTAFAAAGEQAPALVEEVDAPAVETKSRFVSFSETKSDRPELVSARVVLAGGCGLLDETGFSSSRRLPTSWAPPSARPARRSTWGSARTTGRSARRARSWRPISTSAWAFRAPSSTRPASRTPR